MTYLLNILKRKDFYAVLLAVVFSVLFVTIAVSGATTISTNIDTGGTLTVSGISQMNGSLQASSTALFTGVARHYEQLNLYNSTSNPSSSLQGSIYWDSTNKVVRAYDGSAWFALGTTTSGLTLSGTRLQMANLTTDHLTFGTTSVGAVAGSRLLTLSATTTATVPFTIYAAKGGSQTGNLFDVFDSNENELFSIDKDGNASSTAAFTLNSNLYINGFATTTGSSGNIATQGTLTVTGNATFSNGAIVFNEDSGDNDFRIEGDTVTNAFVVDAGLDSVGIASTTPWGLFSVEAVGSTVNNNVPIFVVGDQGTTTPFFYVSGVDGSIGVGTSSPFETLSVQGDAVFNSGATTTVKIHSTASATGGCLELTGMTDGTAYRLIATSTGLAYWEQGACQ